MADAAATTTATPGRRANRLSKMIELIEPARPLRIADVGANPVHVPDYTDLLKAGGCEVWGFEPEPEAFAALERDALPGSHFVQRAVGKSGKATFYPHHHSGLGSLLKVDKAAVEYLGHPQWHPQQEKGEAIDIVALDKVPEKELPKPDVLKIDIQGGELNVFKYGRKKLSRAVAIVTEVRFFQIYEGDPMWSDLDVELRKQGFVLHRLLSPKAVAVKNSISGQMRKGIFRNQLMDGDAVYIRDPLGIDDWDDDQVTQLAIAAMGVFGSYDLVMFCLDTLVERGVLAPEVPQNVFDNLPKWMRI